MLYWYHIASCIPELANHPIALISMLLIPLLARGPFVGNGNLAVMCTDIAEEHGAQHESVPLWNPVPLVSLEQILYQEGLPFPYMRGLIDCGFQQGIQVFHKQISSIFIIVLILNIVIFNVHNIDIIGQKNNVRQSFSRSIISHTIFLASGFFFKKLVILCPHG